MGAAQRIWDESKHPRGFGGKFATSAGGGSGKAKKSARQLFASADHAALHGKTVVQLRQDAKTAGLKGHSRTRKATLVDALVAHHHASTKRSEPSRGPDAVHAAPYMLGEGGSARNGVDTRDVDSALSYYKGAGYLGINEDLRKGVKNGREQGDINAIDAGMGPLTADVEVYRGIHKASKVFGPAWNERDVTGLTWRDDAFASTSADGKASGSAFSSAGGAIMRIRVPKGTKAVGVTDRAEMEILLNRGLTYRVVKDNGVIDGKRRLDVEVIG